MSLAESTKAGTAPASSQSKRTTHFPELDGLRGLAILLVVLCHYVANADHARLGFWPHHFLSALTVGWSGVDMFFVLSGFLIGGILLDVRESPRYFKTFYARRIFRILPIYYLWILIYALIVVAGLYGGFARLPVERRDVNAVPVYLLFLQNLIYAPSPFQWKWFVVTWSLAVEEQFYLLAPIVIRHVSVRRLFWLLGVVICVAPLLRLSVYMYLPRFSYLAGFAMPCRADALSLGILAAAAWRQDRFKNYLSSQPAVLSLCLALLFVPVAALAPWFVRPTGVVTYAIGYSALAMFYTCLLLHAITQADGFVAKILRAHWLRYLGGISYCVYLVHLTINQWAHHLLLHSEPQLYDLRGLSVTLLAAVVTWIVAATSWKYVEGPALGRGHQFVY
ncbi:MAG: acyltransferase [Candidatus Acidiferrum sp.]|jgi:peptidoglycan/LPS O-acetylase OafA/YrhL